jgi:beta-phosphoglucomutase-like phosphatase (HAD superfamily)
MIKAILFDIDGVLINTFEANLKFFQDLMRNTGYPEPTREEYRNLFHRTMIDAIRILTRSKDENKIQEIFTMGRDRRF